MKSGFFLAILMLAWLAADAEAMSLSPRLYPHVLKMTQQGPKVIDNCLRVASCYIQAKYKVYDARGKVVAVEFLSEHTTVPRIKIAEFFKSESETVELLYAYVGLTSWQPQDINEKWFTVAGAKNFSQMFRDYLQYRTVISNDAGPILAQFHNCVTLKLSCARRDLIELDSYFNDFLLNTAIEQYYLHQDSIRH